MFDIGRNTTTLSKFIGCIDLIDFHQISPKHPRNNDKGKCVEKFWYLKYLSCGVHLRNTSQIFLASLTLDPDINSTNQNIEKARHTLVDWCLVNETAAILLMQQHPMPDKFNRRTFGCFMPYWLLTLPQRKVA